MVFSTSTPKVQRMMLLYSRTLAAHCWTHIVSLLFGVMHFSYGLSVTFSLDPASSAFSAVSTRWFPFFFAPFFSISTPKVQKMINLVDLDNC